MIFSGVDGKSPQSSTTLKSQSPPSKNNTMGQDSASLILTRSERVRHVETREDQTPTPDTAATPESAHS